MIGQANFVESVLIAGDATPLRHSRIRCIRKQALAISMQQIARISPAKDFLDDRLSVAYWNLFFCLFVGLLLLCLGVRIGLELVDGRFQLLRVLAGDFSSEIG